MWVSAAALVLALVFQSWEAARILERIGIHPLLFGSARTNRNSDDEQSVGLTSEKALGEEKDEDEHSA